MRILHLLSQRPSHTGSGVAVQAMIREAACRGHDNRLIAGIPAGEEPEAALLGGARATYVRFGTDALPFPVPGMSDVMPYASTRFSDMSDGMLRAYERAFERALDQALAAWTPDVVHAHHLWIATTVARRRLPGTPVVAQCHGSDLRQHALCPRISRRLRPALADLAGALALTHAQRGEIAALLGGAPERVHVVGAGYRDGLFRAAHKPAPEPARIAYAGKLARAKGVPMLLDALAAVEAPWRLELFGASGDDGREVLERVARLGERVTLRGAVSQAVLAEGLAGCHVFALPSFYEGLPLVLLEALASGCRLVATDLPGVRELLGGLPADIARLVPLPRMQGVDEPAPDAIPGFVADLARALAAQIEAARRAPAIDASRAAELLGEHTWSGVYDRVQAVLGALTRSDGG
jgi:glycosyltransferase involved in cell wall biosynthesis